MSQYICEICEKDFKTKFNYMAHTNKKYPCSKPCVIVDKDNKNMFQCEYCNVTFARKDALKRHITNSCKQKIKNNEHKILETLSEMKTQMEGLQKTCETLTNENIELKATMNKRGPKKKIIDNSTNNTLNDNSITNNGNVTINTIMLIPFGEEDIGKYINDTQCNQIMERGINSITELATRLHFDPNKPELHTCHLSNNRDNKIRVYNGKKWILEKEDIVFDKMIEKNDEFLENKYDEITKNKKITSKAKQMFGKYQKAKNDKIIDLNKVYYNDLKSTCYNGRDIVEKTKNQIKQDNLTNQNVIKNL